MDKEIIEYNKNLNKIVCIKNSITLICFTVLAIVFNKWWIILFAALFLTFIENKEIGDE